MADEAGGGAKGKVEDPKMQAIFSLCGLYMIWWLYQRVLEVNANLGREAIKPVIVLASFLCLPIIFYAIWLMAGAVHEMREKAGLGGEDEKVMDLVWFLLCGPIGVFKMQSKLNEVWEK
jgi:hypothetical protein